MMGTCIFACNQSNALSSVLDLRQASVSRLSICFEARPLGYHDSNRNRARNRCSEVQPSPVSGRQDSNLGTKNQPLHEYEFYTSLLLRWSLFYSVL